MGNAYTTSAEVLYELPADTPQEIQDLIDTWIEDESRDVDAELPNYTTPFAATPDTPSIVSRATRYLVMDRAIRMGGLMRQDDGSVPETYRKDAMNILRDLRDGVRVIPYSQR